MTKMHLIVLAFSVLALAGSCKGPSGEKESNTRISASGPVEVFYFHNTRRCATCNAVEDVTRTTLAEQFDQEIPFTSYNLEEEDGKKKAAELGVAGQTLLVVKGEKKINLTNEGFMYARSNPDQLKQVLAENIRPLL